MERLCHHGLSNNGRSRRIKEGEKERQNEKIARKNERNAEEDGVGVSAMSFPADKKLFNGRLEVQRS